MIDQILEQLSVELQSLALKLVRPVVMAHCRLIFAKIVENLPQGKVQADPRLIGERLVCQQAFHSADERTVGFGQLLRMDQIVKCHDLPPVDGYRTLKGGNSLFEPPQPLERV